MLSNYRMKACSYSDPEAPTPPPVGECHRCGEDIVPGDHYITVDGVNYCEYCIEDMTYEELIRLLGFDWKEAREEDIYDGYDG